MKILIIQTAFLGDVILSTALVERLAIEVPKPCIHLLVREGNQAVYDNNPHVEKVWTWNKSEGKYKNLWQLAVLLRKEQFTWVLNCHRFASSGMLALMLGSQVVGFNKNPLSMFFKFRLKHQYDTKLHEVDRNASLLSPICFPGYTTLPKLYPSSDDYKAIEIYLKDNYCVIAPASVWATKQYPLANWAAFINEQKYEYYYLIGGSGDSETCEAIKKMTKNKAVTSLAGKLSLLQSACLMQKATHCYTNDSAPTHIASAMNATVSTVYCSTIPDFGFGPLSKESFVLQHPNSPKCRPCGIHGKKACPQGHFNCAAFSIT